MFEEITGIDQITVNENKIIFVRYASKVLRNGEEISKTYIRESFSPGDDISGKDIQIQNIAKAVWTQ